MLRAVKLSCFYPSAFMQINTVVTEIKKIVSEQKFSRKGTQVKLWVVDKVGNLRKTEK